MHKLIRKHRTYVVTGGNRVKDKWGFFVFLGRVINKLRNNEDEDIKKAAKTVYVKWRNHFVEHMERPMMEVKCDLKTEKTRTSGRNLLAGALSMEVSNDGVSHQGIS